MPGTGAWWTRCPSNRGWSVPRWRPALLKKWTVEGGIDQARSLHAPDFTPPTLAERIDAYLANGWDASALLERAALARAR